VEAGGQLHASAALDQGKYFLYLSSRKLGGLQNRSGSFGKDKNPLPLPGIEPRFLGCPAHSVVTTEKKLRHEII